MFVHPLSSVDYLQMYTYRCTTTHLSGLPTTVHMFVQPLTTVDYLQLYICLYIHTLQWIIFNSTQSTYNHILRWIIATRIQTFENSKWKLYYLRKFIDKHISS